ncbi:hypothetical protein J7M28_04950 [bacterium]|nr:hypothetical protein [bacterium]
MSRFLTVFVCITALVLMSGAALATWDSGTEPYTGTGEDKAAWRWFVDPGDKSGRAEGYGSSSLGERGLNYSYAWGAGFYDTWFYYDWSGPPFWVMGDNGSHTGADGTGEGYYNLQIDADIEMFANEWMENSLLYFHRLTTVESMNAYWDYWIESNNGMWVFLTVDDDCCWGGLDSGYLPYLDMVNRRPAPYDWDDTSGKPGARGYETETTCPNMGSRYYVDNTAKGGSAADVVLPIDFYMKANGEGSAAAGTYVLGDYSAEGNSGTLMGITWYPDETGVLRYPGKRGTTFKANLLPHKYQPDGRYIMDPIVELAPYL